MNSLSPHLQRLAATRHLLVATDFDGVLAPIAPTPDVVRPDPEAIAALSRLSVMPRTSAAIISGRALRDLRTALPDDHWFLLFGSHGAESDLLVHAPGSATPVSVLARIIAVFREAAATHPSFLIEEKPFGAALHFRLAPDAFAVPAIRHARRLLAEAGIAVREGAFVIEASTRDSHKGQAIEALRRRVAADAVVCIGDDLTDEDAFAALAPDDLSIKVGPGETRARFRLARQSLVAEVLSELADLRAAHLASASAPPIEKLSVLSDQRTVAMIDHRASLRWMCVPRIDSTATFASLLSTPDAGSFDIAPLHDEGDPLQHYEPDTFLLRSVWPSLQVRDYLDCAGGRAYQRAGRTDLLRVVDASAPALVRFAPRPDFARVPARLVIHPDGIELSDSADPMVLRSPGVSWRIIEEGRHQSAVAELPPRPEPYLFELRCGTSSLGESVMTEPRRREQTMRFWQSWTASLRVPQRYAQLVKRSALVLKALTHGPTGAIAAAGTTSLPEDPGGVRNWDYRFCWPRDAAFAASALVMLGNTGHAMKLADWMLGVLDRIESPERLRPIYTVSGGNLAPEAEIPDLAGYCSSRPVRIGNAAAMQVQLDVFGPLTEMVLLAARHGAPVTPEHWRLVEAMVRAVARRWREPDHGIWEIRLPPRHHVHSKVMCWVTADRALQLAQLYLGREPEDWRVLRDAIAADVLARGFNTDLGAFTTAYDIPELDAAALQVGLSGLLPAHDPRFTSTVRAIESSLRRGAGVYRYLFDDGIPGREGAFLLCSFWLVEAYCLCGRDSDASELFESIVALAGPTGLLPEQYCPRAGLALGNHPQAYSHAALISAAVRLG